ncbi:MAG: translation initiation factor eIF-1A [Promethearchaeota archaeon]
MSPKKGKRGKRKKEKLPPDLFIRAEVQEQTQQGTNTIVLRVRKPAKGELFGVVLKNLGDYRLKVQCADGKTRVSRIRGTMRKRKWVRVGDTVLIEPWYGLDEDRKADVKHRYFPREKRVLENRGMLKELEAYL